MSAHLEKTASQDHSTNGSSKDPEKGVDPAYVVPAENKFNFHPADLDRVQRRLKQRHVQMIAIAGTIGTGLFLGSGASLGRAGPAGALIGYIIVGSVAYSSLCAVGEMTSHAPISGTFPHFAARWVDPAWGFATGANYFYTNLITIPAEVTAAVLVLGFWDENHSHQIGYTALLCVAMSAINIFGVRWFGESEFFFSIIKLMLITGLIIAGLVIDLGGGPNHERIGFRYWRDPGAFNTYLKEGDTGRFLAILGVFVQAGFSFQGMELVAVSAAETENPRRNIAKAVRRVFYRIIFFYIVGIIVTGMLVPYNDDALLSAATSAAQSPYVIAIRRAGISGLPSVINAAVFSSAFSAGNSFLYCASRILYGLSVRGQAPKIFAYCTKKGLPIIAVLFCASFSLLSFMNVSNASGQVFTWFVNLSTIGGFFSWFSINLTYYRFYCGMKAQGIDRTKLIYFSSMQPWLSYWGMFWNAFFILFNGFDVFFDFNVSDFFTCYINVALFFIFYFGWKIWKKTKFWRASEMDFWTGVPTIEETETEYVPPRTISGKIFEALF
ncbi:general APC amino acid permease [Exidia glandulosa HHB12029]|uniref:General APC amino acid permease n=1 Tax=Exidia glandulosa HHB12029 TaxID=1314781 RepID=A0A165F1T4_EXIGL|nr:general APC amino acid permease [Exidia glandulosa HHB12029]